MDGNDYTAANIGYCTCERKIHPNADVLKCVTPSKNPDECLKDEGCRAYRNGQIEQLNPDLQEQDI